MPNEIFIYGDIGESWWGDYVTAKDVLLALQDLPESDGLDVRINTYGGDVGEGLSIMNSIRAYARKQMAINSSFKLRSIVDGFAYSAGTLIMLAGDVRIMNPGTKAMVHNPLTMAYGNYMDFEKLAVEYKDHASYMADLYSQASKKEKKEWQAFMDDETYFTSNEAVKVGLATEEEKYEPLTVPESNKAKTGKDRLLVPSAVYESNRDVLDKLPKIGKGGYQQALLFARQQARNPSPTSPLTGQPTSPTTDPKIGEKNSTSNEKPYLSTLLSKMQCDILEAESKLG